MTYVTLGALLFAGAATASAEVYRYDGPNGEVIFSSEPMAGATPTRVESTPRPASNMEQGSVTGPLAGAGANAGFDSIIREAADNYDLPFAFIKAVIHVESAFDPTAVSHAGAMGLMQLMPGTAQSLGCNDPFDPRVNILAGALYLRLLANRYNGDINLTLAAYNAGPARVDRVQGVPFEDTARYIERVLRLFNEYQQLEEE